jgi:hypothetical protein
MSKKPAPARGIPDWFVEAVRVMQDVDRELNNMQAELTYGVRLQDLDAGLRDDMQHLQHALVAVKLGLSVMEITARRVLLDLPKSDPPQSHVASAA